MMGPGGLIGDASDGFRLAGGAAIIIGAIHAFFRFLRWAVEFSCGRLDMRSDRVGQREQDYEDKIERRLAQLEDDVARYRRATVILNGALARIDPSNPALSEVATILARGYPVKDQDLIDKLDGLS